ncbi:MAG: hypothetical protein ACKVY0_11155 [Prosthecobacter sp.]|uniref:hypothetical protein n=1 Tax=Prosthecobacter sp. TaxID=1965333 RepID=UPI003901401A
MQHFISDGCAITPELAFELRIELHGQANPVHDALTEHIEMVICFSSADRVTEFE